MAAGPTGTYTLDGTVSIGLMALEQPREPSRAGAARHATGSDSRNRNPPRFQGPPDSGCRAWRWAVRCGYSARRRHPPHCGGPFAAVNEPRSGDDAIQGGEVNGWQLKAMPGVVRQRVFTMRLLCFDKELGPRSGQQVVLRRPHPCPPRGLRVVLARGDAVAFQDLRNNTSTLVVIDDYRFEQGAQPGANQSNYGGVLWGELRTIADVITV